MTVDIDLIMPRTMTDALEAMAARAPDIVPFAGATNVLVSFREDPRRYKALMDVKAIKDMQGIRRDNGRLMIGGAVTIAEVLADPLVARHAPLLKRAAAVFANPLIRNRATVGGNLVDASPAADMAPPLLALDAEIELVSIGGRRLLPLDDFFVHVNKTRIQPDELLATVRWPIPTDGSASAFYKLGLRKADSISVVSVAVHLERDEAGVCRLARIALGSVAPRPLRAYAAEKALVGRAITPELIQEAGRLSREVATPIDDVRGSADYRRRMVDTLVQRCLSRALKDLARQE
jgi:CO/xanthine dehydrogenase FAD-binding subunit